MKQIKIFIELTRLNKPIGFMLLFWPCLWGLTLGYYFNTEANLYLKNLILFFLGSVLMRSAGCIFNDIVDRNLDKKVKRTKKRPIASGKISVSQSFIYVIGLCFIAFVVCLAWCFGVTCGALQKSMLNFFWFGAILPRCIRPGWPSHLRMCLY